MWMADGQRMGYDLEDLAMGGSEIQLCSDIEVRGTTNGKPCADRKPVDWRR
jgi:hypothetical protein